MNQVPPKKGTLWISSEVLHQEKWILDQVLSTTRSLMTKYQNLDAFLSSSPVRQGDFSLIFAVSKIDPILAIFIGIPGRQRAAIVEELFVAS